MSTGVSGQEVPVNPAAPVRGPKHIVYWGKDGVIGIGRGACLARQHRDDAWSGGSVCQPFGAGRQSASYAAPTGFSGFQARSRLSLFASIQAEECCVVVSHGPDQQGSVKK
jgi:hypothetical protein